VPPAPYLLALRVDSMDRTASDARADRAGVVVSRK
jgi:hypothetical protein